MPEILPCSMDAAKRQDNDSAVTAKNGLDTFAWEMRLIYLCGFLFFFLNAMNIVPVVAKINLVKTGSSEETSSAASFVAFTVYFLQNFTQFLLVKYTAALSDYCGRKPMLLMAAAAHGLSSFIFATSSTDAMFYTAGIIGGSFQYFNIITGKRSCTLNTFAKHIL